MIDALKIYVAFVPHAVDFAQMSYDSETGKLRLSGEFDGNAIAHALNAEAIESDQIRNAVASHMTPDKDDPVVARNSETLARLRERAPKFTYGTSYDEPTPVVAPLTLDDVTRHTDALCAEYRQRMLDHQAWYTERVGQLSAAIEASEGLNHMEAGYIFLTKIRELTAPPETVTSEPAPVGEWVEWSGGDRPVPGDTLVTVRLAPEGMEADGYARDIQWDAPSPIMAYRVNA